MLRDVWGDGCCPTERNGSMKVTGQRRQSNSPATRKGFHVGREPGNKGRTWPPEPLERDEFEAILAQLSTKSNIGVRNRALLIVLYRTGLRINEALALHSKDVARDMNGHGMVRVMHGKGDKYRIAGIDDKALEAVEQWREKRTALGLNGEHRLFCALHGTPLYASYVQALLKKLAVKAGIEKRVHPHGLRHTHAYELMMEGVSIGLIKGQLGHSNIGTTSRYLDHIAPTQVTAAIHERGEW